MTRAEVAKRLGIKPWQVAAIEREAFKKIKKQPGLYARCEGLLDEINIRASRPTEHALRLTDIERLDQGA